MPNNNNLKDALLSQSLALPAAVGSVNSTGFQLQPDANGDFLANTEFVVAAPALTTTQLPDNATAAYIVQTATDTAFTSPVTIATIGTQTGAGGVGAAAATYRYRPPVETLANIRLKITTAVSAGNCVSSSATSSLVF